MRRLTTAFLVVFLAGSISLAVAQAADQPVKPGAKLLITYELDRIAHVASNQIAVWIEDGDGNFICTVYISDYTGRREGWKARPTMLRNWAQASNVANTPKEEIDAVSGATPWSGPVSVTWDLKNTEGNIVPAGTYCYRVEGSIMWEKTVLWTGKIKIGTLADSSEASASYFPPDKDLAGKLITSVAAEFVPGQ